MSKNILLAVDAASHDPARHVLAAAGMTRDLSRDSGDHVIVLHVHEFATGRFGRIQVDCGDGEGEGVVSKIVAELQAAGVSAEGEIRETRLGHIAAAILHDEPRICANCGIERGINAARQMAARSGPAYDRWLASKGPRGRGAK